MKKVFGVILSLCILLSAFSVNVFAADEATTEDPHEETRAYTEAFNKQLSKGDVTGDKKVTTEEARQLFADGIISGGMIPKVECCIDAIEKGVRRVTILDGRVPHALLLELLTDEGAGTLVKGVE